MRLHKPGLIVALATCTLTVITLLVARRLGGWARETGTGARRVLVASNEKDDAGNVITITDYSVLEFVYDEESMRRPHKKRTHERPKRNSRPARPARPRRPSHLDHALSVPLWLDELDGRTDNRLTLTNRGRGVTVYVIDSGCNGDAAFSFLANDPEASAYTDPADHGRFVHSIIRTLVPDVRTICLRVFGADSRGNSDGVANAFDWARANCTTPSKCVINFSGQSPGRYEPLIRAIGAAVKSGIAVVAAAGNVNYYGGAVIPSETVMNSCDWVPSGVPGVIAVGAGDADFNVATWSRIGGCVSAFGPGDGVALEGRLLYGTSFAAPCETARRAQCASLGVSCDESADHVYDAVIYEDLVNAYPTLAEATPTRWVMLN